jgi:hypothetical protein
LHTAAADDRGADRDGPSDGAIDCLGGPEARWVGKRSSACPPEPPNGYERRRPGELIHIDVKKLGRVLKPGHRVTGDRRGQASTRRNGKHVGLAGWEFVHVATDDHSRLAYTEILSAETGVTAIGFLNQALEFLRRLWRERAARDDR